MERFVSRILDETGTSKSVKSIVFDESKQRWVIEWNNPSLPEDEFEFLDELYDFLNHG